MAWCLETMMDGVSGRRSGNPRKECTWDCHARSGPYKYRYVGGICKVNGTKGGGGEWEGQTKDRQTDRLREKEERETSESILRKRQTRSH